MMIAILLVVTPVAAAPEDKIDCNENPDHPFCNGKRGQDGFVFCTLQTDQQTSCWDDQDVPQDDRRIYCAEDPETKEACKLNN